MMSAFVTVRAEEKTDNTDALDMFGFNLDSDSYDTNAIKPGTYPVSPKYDLYVDNYSNIQKYKWYKTVGNIVAWPDIYKESFLQHITITERIQNQMYHNSCN